MDCNYQNIDGHFNCRSSHKISIKANKQHKNNNLLVLLVIITLGGNCLISYIYHTEKNKKENIFLRKINIWNSILKKLCFLYAAYFTLKAKLSTIRNKWEKANVGRAHLMIPYVSKKRQRSGGCDCLYILEEIYPTNTDVHHLLNNTF